MSCPTSDSCEKSTTPAAPASRADRTFSIDAARVEAIGADARPQRRAPADPLARLLDLPAEERLSALYAIGQSASSTPRTPQSGQSWNLWLIAVASSGTTAADTRTPGRSARAARRQAHRQARQHVRRYSSHAATWRSGAVTGSPGATRVRAKPSSAWRE